MESLAATILHAECQHADTMDHAKLEEVQSEEDDGMELLAAMEALSATILYAECQRSMVHAKLEEAKLKEDSS